MADQQNSSLERQQRFEQTALPHLDSVYRAAVALCGRRDEAEDLTQATFVKALERFETYSPGTNCRAWLLQILRNTWIDQLRQRKVRGTTVPLDEARAVEEPEVEETVWSDAEDLLENFSDEQVIGALKSLPDDQRLTLFLIDVERLSQQDVGVAVGTVKSRTSRARNELKKRLQPHAEEMGFTGATGESSDR